MVFVGVGRAMFGGTHSNVFGRTKASNAFSRPLNNLVMDPVENVVRRMTDRENKPTFPHEWFENFRIMMGRLESERHSCRVEFIFSVLKLLLKINTTLTDV